MKEWLVANLDWLVPSILSVLSALCGCTTFSLIRTTQLSKALNHARESKYYTICPHCKKKVYLDQIHLYMPDGALDDNLNGKPDASE